MTAFTKLNGWAEHIAKAVNIASDQFKVLLSNTAPGSESTPPTGATSACVAANVTEVSYTNCSSRNLTTTGHTQSSGTLALSFADLILTAGGGSVGPFRYIYICDDTPTSPADPLMGYYDYGSSVTLADTETFTLDFGANVLTLA